MNIELIIETIVDSVKAIGWVVNHIFSLRLERRRHNLTAQLKYTERQLEELYGPLAFLLIEREQVFKDLLSALGRNYVFVEGQELAEDELKTWLFWVENSFLPSSKKIGDLLESKVHLIEGNRLPDSYKELVMHFSSWEIRHQRWKKEKVEYSWHSSVSYPQQFSVDVF